MDKNKKMLPAPIPQASSTKKDAEQSNKSVKELDSGITKLGESGGKAIERLANINKTVSTLKTSYSLLKEAKAFLKGDDKEEEKSSSAFEKLKGAAQSVGNAIDGSKDQLLGFLNVTGAFKNLGDSFDKLKGKAFEGMKAPLEGAADEINKAFEELAAGDAFKNLSESLGSVAQQAAEGIGEILPQIMEATKEILPVLGELAKTVLPPIFDLITDLVPTLTTIVGSIAPIIMELLPTVKGILDEVLPMLSERIGEIVPMLLKAAAEVLPLLMDAFSKLLPPIMELISALLPPLVNIFMALLPPLQQIISTLLPPLTTLFETLAPVIEAMTPAITKLAAIIGSAFYSAFSNLMPVIQWFLDILQDVLNFLTFAFTAGWDGVWEAIVSTFITAIQIIPNTIKEVVDKAFGLFKKIFDGIKDFASSIGFDVILDLFPKLPRFKTGLDYVPSDYFPAFLDEGEAVLTKREATIYRALGGSLESLVAMPAISQSYGADMVNLLGSMAAGDVNFTQNNYSPKALSRYEINRNTQQMLQLMAGKR